MVNHRDLVTPVREITTCDAPARQAPAAQAPANPQAIGERQAFGPARPCIHDLGPAHPAMPTVKVATYPDCWSPVTVASSDSRLSAKMVSRVFEVGFTPRDA